MVANVQKQEDLLLTSGSFCWCRVEATTAFVEVSFRCSEVKWWWWCPF